MAKATHRLRDAFKNYVNDKKTTLLASYLPLAVSRIAGMILAYQKELHGDGEPPPFAAWDRKTWPPLLRQLSRLTDSSAAEDILFRSAHFSGRIEHFGSSLVRACPPLAWRPGALDGVRRCLWSLRSLDARQLEARKACMYAWPKPPVVGPGLLACRP